MLNSLFYAGIGVVSYIIAVGVMKLDKYLFNKQVELEIVEKGLSQTNWFLKYELYRREILNNAKKTGNI